jgi:hypothetical protein
MEAEVRYIGLYILVDTLSRLATLLSYALA